MKVSYSIPWTRHSAHLWLEGFSLVSTAPPMPQLFQWLLMGNSSDAKMWSAGTNLINLRCCEQVVILSAFQAYGMQVLDRSSSNQNEFIIMKILDQQTFWWGQMHGFRVMKVTMPNKCYWWVKPLWPHFTKISSQFHSLMVLNVFMRCTLTLI